MLFSMNTAAEQEVIAAAMVIAVLYLHASDVHQHTFNRSQVRLWSKTPTSEVYVYKICAHVDKTWILSNSWATGWRMHVIIWTLESLNGFQKCLDLMSLNAMKCVCG